MTNTSRHTPGPWVVNDFCTENGADVAIWTSHDPHTAKSICECHFNTVREIQRGEHGCHQIEAEANARLIAAAPDLLAAAQAAWNCIGELPPTQARVEVGQMLCAAIKKATEATE